MLDGVLTRNGTTLMDLREHANTGGSRKWYVTVAGKEVGVQVERSGVERCFRVVCSRVYSSKNCIAKALFFAHSIFTGALN